MRDTETVVPAKWFLATCCATVLAEVFLWPHAARLLQSCIGTDGAGERILGTWLFGVVPGALVFLLAYSFLWLRHDPSQAERRVPLVHAFWIANGVLLILALVNAFAGQRSRS